MAKEGKRLELYEVLAAKRARGRPLLVEPKPLVGKPAKPPESIVVAPVRPEIRTRPKTSVLALPPPTLLPPPPPIPPPPPVPPSPPPVPQMAPEPILEPPRPRRAREVVLALDIAFLLFVIILALSASAYFLGYKRGQEERPVTLTGLADVENANPDQLNLRMLSMRERVIIRPPEQDYTLVLRKEPVKDSLPSRLDLELREAMEVGSQALKENIQGFIFKTPGNEPYYILAVGLGKTSNDPGLNKMLQFYNKLESVSLSRENRPYSGAGVNQVKILGELVE